MATATVTKLKPVDNVSPVRVRKPAKKPAIKITATQARTFGRLMGMFASSWLPIVGYCAAHFGVNAATTLPQTVMMYSLMVFCLVFSAPSVAEWTQKWTGSATKAWAWTLVLELAMVQTVLPIWVALISLTFLVGINGDAAWQKTKKIVK